METDTPTLHQMQDVVLPSPISWWPLAPGWWVLLGGMLIVSLLLLIALHRQWRRNAYRRAGLRELEAAPDIISVTNLLKRIALAVYPRETVASLTGERWIAWLEQTGAESVSANVRPLLIASLYDGWGQGTIPIELRRFARSWIKEHRRPC